MGEQSVGQLVADTAFTIVDLIPVTGEFTDIAYVELYKEMDWDYECRADIGCNIWEAKGDEIKSHLTRAFNPDPKVRQEYYTIQISGGAPLYLGNSKTKRVNTLQAVPVFNHGKI